MLAVLQTARRILAEGGELLKTGWSEKRSKKTLFSMDGALREALNLAHPLNRDESWWAARHAILEAIGHNPALQARGRGMLVFNNHPDTTLADAITVYDDAIKAQGRMKVAVSKAKGRK